MEKTPGLFGQIHSNRDYRKQETWGKNQFNSSFPASLVAYMQVKQTEPVYLTLDKNSNIKHKNISGEDLFGMSPLSENLFYGFEQTYQPFAKFYTGKSERIDLVFINSIRPKWFVMENVERITKTKKLIDAKKIFKEAGYGLSWQVLDASKCGLAAYISEPIHRKA